MFRFFKHIQELGRFQQLPTVKKCLVFYSEGENYWVHLEGLIKELLENYEIEISFIRSNENDPGLQLKHPRYHSFEIDEGWIRNWLFENIETDVMVMTMPDVGQYQVKRSKKSCALRLSTAFFGEQTYGLSPRRSRVSLYRYLWHRL